MILQEALCNLRDEILTSGYFNRFYEYAEIIPKGSESYPQVYLSNGQYKPVFDLDVNGTGYFRKYGSSYMDQSVISLMGCSDTNPMVDLVVPMRLVAAVPKSKLGDNSFSDDQLAAELIGYISKKQSAIDTVQSVHGKVSSYQTDRARVWSDEVMGIDKLIDLRLSFISIDFTLTFRALLSCLQTNCMY